MHLKFSYIKIENFLSIGKAELQLSDLGYVLVKGINRCDVDNAVSNGSGKSSIHDAILWALTGETSRGTKNVVNIFGDDGALVECGFYRDNDLCVVIRSKNHSTYKTDLKIFINGEDVSGKGIRDSEKIFTEKLFANLDAALLGGVVLLGQGLPYRFSNNTPSKRKEMLEKLSKSDFMIEDIKERISVRKDVLTKQISALHDNEIELESKRLFTDKNITSLENELEDLMYLVSNINEETLEKHINDIRSMIGDIDGELGMYNLARQKYVDLLSFAVAPLSQFEEREDIVNLNNELTSVKESLVSISTKATEVKKQYTKLDSVIDVCPTCGQKIPGAVKIDTTELHEEYQRLKEEYYNATARKSDIENEIERKKREFLEKNEYNKREVEESIRDVDIKIEKRTSAKKSLTEEYNKANNELIRLDAEKSGSQKRMDNIRLQIETLRDGLKNIQKEAEDISNKISTLEIRKDVVAKMETLAKRDFRGYLLTGIIEYIEQRARIYSNDIFETDKVSIRLDGNEIDISYNGKEYEMLSGGEKQKIDIIVQLAIRDMLCALMDFSCNIIVFDEIFDFLDSKGTNALLKSISSRLQDVGSIFIITHHTDIDIPRDMTIEVNKNNEGVSSISSYF